MSIAAGQVVGAVRGFSVDEVLSPYIFVFYAAFVVSFVFTPVMRGIAIHFDIVDRPDGVRKMHTRPMAYLGGVAVFLGWMAGLAISQFARLHGGGMAGAGHVTINMGIVAAGCCIVVLGLWDDIAGIRPATKIFGQVCAAVCLLGSGVGRKAAWVVVGPVLIRMCNYLHWPAADVSQLVFLRGHWVLEAASAAFVIALVVGCCNATNLMDGLDGLCGGVTAIVSAGFLFLAMNLAMYSGGTSIDQDALRVVLALALLGGVLGFVPFNFNPASIFMGDTGSMFLGFVCATTMVLFTAEAHFKWFLAALVIFSLPILDTALAFARRWINGRPFFSPDKQHLHHQLVARGFSVKQTVLISYGMSIFFGVLGTAIVFVRTRYAVAVYLVVFGSLIVAAIKMGMVHERVEGKAGEPEPRAAERAKMPAEAARAGAAVAAKGAGAGLLAGGIPVGAGHWAEPKVAGTEAVTAR